MLFQCLYLNHEKSYNNKERRPQDLFAHWDTTPRANHTQMQGEARQNAAIKFKGVSTDIVPEYTVSIAGMELDKVSNCHTNKQILLSVYPPDIVPPRAHAISVPLFESRKVV
jgi:hypothetical protein